MTLAKGKSELSAGWRWHSRWDLIARPLFAEILSRANDEQVKENNKRLMTHEKAEKKSWKHKKKEEKNDSLRKIMQTWDYFLRGLSKGLG